MRWDGSYACVPVGDDLSLANGNRGYELIDPRKQAALLSFLDTVLRAYRMMSVEVVSIAVPYPLLVPGFPNSDKYMRFYRQVVEKVRLWGFKLHVDAGIPFPDSVFGNPQLRADLLYWYQGITPVRYKQEKLIQLQLIIDSLQSDYLTLENEPYTQQANIMNKISFSSPWYAHYVNYFAINLNTGGRVKLGAGAGTWDSLVFFQVAAGAPVDFIDMHVYPPHFHFMHNRMLVVDTLARAAGKCVAIGEAWCYKATFYELVSARSVTLAEVFARDVFEWWYDIDTLFVRAIMIYSFITRPLFIGFFWPTVKFGQLVWNPSVHDTMMAGQLLVAGWSYGYERMRIPALSQVGEYIQRWMV